MPKRISLAEHEKVEELERYYRQAKDAVARSQYQIIWLLAQGKKTEEVAEVTGYSRTWIYEIVSRYNQGGVEVLGDRRHQNAGGEAIISDVQQAQLWQALETEAPDGGVWNGRKVADWLSQLLGRKVHRQRGWEILRGMGYRLRVPRPQHQKSASDAEQQEWKKNSSRNSKG